MLLGRKTKQLAALGLVSDKCGARCPVLSGFFEHPQWPVWQGGDYFQFIDEGVVLYRNMTQDNRVTVKGSGIWNRQAQLPPAC